MSHERCKGNLEAEREAQKLLAPDRKISKETGIPMGPLGRADGILFRCKKESLSPAQQRIVIAEALHSAYWSGHKQGRDYQRRIAKKRASVPSEDRRPEETSEILPEAEVVDF